jgi:putative ABC transport system permease protein
VFLLRLIAMALRSLDANFLRSVLAALGVVIGVMAIISAMSIMEGQREEILGKFKALGSNILFVVPSQIQRMGYHKGTAETLRLTDIPKIKEECQDIEAISPVVYVPQLLKYFSRTAQAVVRGTNAAFAKMHGLEIDVGRFFTEEESDSENATVVVLGSGVAEKLFAGTDPIDQPIKVGNRGFRVIGVLQKHGAGSWANVDNSAYIPIRTALRRVLRQKHLARLDIQGTNADSLNDVEKQVRGLIRRLHKIRPGQKEDFEIFNEQRWLELFKESSLIISAVFYSIAGISLVVGGIGITNIMLVSVTERTREIGVRVAVGARKGDILFQFMVEALVISITGGAGGILMGMMFSGALEAILPGLIQVQTSAKVVMAAVTVDVLVGVLSGIYPAYVASRKDPVEALRFE